MHVSIQLKGQQSYRTKFPLNQWAQRRSISAYEQRCEWTRTKKISLNAYKKIVKMVAKEKEMFEMPHVCNNFNTEKRKKMM